MAVKVANQQATTCDFPVRRAGSLKSAHDDTKDGYRAGFAFRNNDFAHQRSDFRECCAQYVEYFNAAGCKINGPYEVVSFSWDQIRSKV